MLSIEFASRAVKDLRRMDRPDRERMRVALEQLAAGAQNLDIKALIGASPYLRLRTGDWRVLYRPFTPQEDPEAPAHPGLLIARVVNRRDLVKAVSTLTT